MALGHSAVALKVELFPHFPGLFAICAAMLAATEALNLILKLWLYRSPWLRIGNIAFGGLAMGVISTQVASESLAIRFGAGAAFGLVYEAVNWFALRFWSFPNDRILFFHGRGVIVGAGLPWGIMSLAAPPLAALLHVG